MEFGTKIQCLILNERGLACLHCSSSAFERFVVTVSPNLSAKLEPVNDFSYPVEPLPKSMFVGQNKFNIVHFPCNNVTCVILNTSLLHNAFVY